ncbi:hypothetical protein BZZ01_16420 [Nostocales cyanobacterium HT-58-2]|nr:hypothetical protein BZZ01_16420 [Nostocales cyanobacterium HT-58-2]
MAALKPWYKLDGLSPREDLREEKPLMFPSSLSTSTKYETKPPLLIIKNQKDFLTVLISLTSKKNKRTGNCKLSTIKGLAQSSELVKNCTASSHWAFSLARNPRGYQ